MTTFNTEHLHSSQVTLTHSVTSLEELKECIKAASVFGFVVGNIKAFGGFTSNTPKESKEDKETHDWYENSEHNTKGYNTAYDDENTTAQSYWKLTKLEGKKLVFVSDNQEYKVRFPLYPQGEDNRSSYDSKATLIVQFTTPEHL